MKRSGYWQVGTYLSIPLSDGSFGYGRVLSDPYLAFYDYRTAAPELDLDVIAARAVLFSLAVRKKGLEHWLALGVQALTGAVAAPVVQFMQSLADPRDCVIFASAGVERPATPEECIGLERAAVWEAAHIEQRLLDTFLGRPNATEQQMRVRLS